MPNLTNVERAVLEQYIIEDRTDAEGAFAPYYHTNTASAGGDPDVAYAVCKSLKKAGLLTCGNERQSAKLLNAPSYWVTDAGKVALTNAS